MSLVSITVYLSTRTNRVQSELIRKIAPSPWWFGPKDSITHFARVLPPTPPSHLLHL